MILVVATGNAGKLVELRELLSGIDLELRSLSELGLPSPEETGKTFAENAELKAHAALCAPDGRLFRAEGRVDGSIALAPRGTNGFGYDPLFLPVETPGRTLAELRSADKNRLSHRGRALEGLRPVLEALARGADPRQQ